MFTLTAAAMAIITFFVHTFIGGRFVARPLLADTHLPKASKWLSYYCWHITTLTIAYLSAAFAWLYFTTQANERTLLAFLAALTTSLSVLSAFVALKGRIHPLRFPSTSLFAMTAILAWTAALQS